MPPPRPILLAGATGLVGRELLARLTADPRCGRLRVWLRRPVAGLTTSPKRSIHQVDFEALPPAPPGLTDACIALGTTIKVAGSKEAFRRVDQVWTTRLLAPLFPLLPRSVRPIEASAVAAALVEALFAGRPGVHRLSSGEMQPR